jgi:septin family protein
LVQALVPFAVCGSREFDESGRRMRKYIWGTVDVENQDHTDIIRLREALIRLNMTVRKYT